MYLCIADMNQEIAALISFLWSQETIYPGGICVWQGFMWNFGDLSSAFWALALAIFSVMYGIYNKDYKYFELIAHACCWGGALFFTLVGFSQSTDTIPYYNNTGQNVWCWVDPYFATQRIFLHYFWIFVVMFVLIVLYCFMGYKLNQIIKRSQNLEKDSAKQSKHLKKVLRKMAGYPFVFFVVFAPITCDRFSRLAGTDPPFDYLMFAISIFASNGFWNATLYFITRKIYQKYAALFRNGLTSTIDSDRGSTTVKDRSGVELNLSRKSEVLSSTGSYEESPTGDESRTGEDSKRSTTQELPTTVP